MTLAAADRNGLGATPTAALSLTLAFAYCCGATNKNLQ